MNAEERARLLREVDQAGNCSHPIRLRGEMVNLATGEVATSALKVACKDRRHVVCPACSYLYRADAWILISSGLVGGKGVSAEIAMHPRLFVTLTAPSFGAVHTVRARGGCVTPPPHGGSTVCAHGMATVCTSRHDDGDQRLGRPLCPRCFDFEGAVLWNAHISRLWNNTVQRIRRSLATSADVPQSSLGTVARLHYLKVAEIQRRGLIHLHVLLRADGPDRDTSVPAWLTAQRLEMVVRSSIRGTSAPGLDGRTLRWGQIFDVSDLASRVDDDRRVASYLAKYATKTTDGSRELAGRFRSRRQIVTLVEDPHYQRLALTAWDLARRADLAPLNLREHAHAFGYAGHLITKSRAFSTTFGALRAARVDFMADRRVADPLKGTFSYEGRGYDDARASELAELFFTMQRELRGEALAARLADEASR